MISPSIRKSRASAGFTSCCDLCLPGFWLHDGRSLELSLPLLRLVRYAAAGRFDLLIGLVSAPPISDKERFKGTPAERVPGAATEDR